MGKIHSILLIFVVLVCLLVAAYLVFLAVSGLNKGYSWQEMDWKQQGETSLGDFFAASDIGKREITIGGGRCFE